MAMLNRSFRQMVVVAALLVLGCVQLSAAQDVTTANFTATEQASTLAFLQGFAAANADLQSLWTGTEFCAWPYVNCYPNLSVLDFNDEGSPAINTTMVLPELSADVNGSEVLFLEIRAADLGELVSGTLPSSWSTMTRLQFVYLSNNALSGTLPESWGSLVGMSDVRLEKNKLSGPLPASWGTLPQLQELYLHDNQLTGTLPAEWSELSIISELNLSNNSLSGSIPSEWGVLYPDFVTLTGNAFCGCLPAEWATKEFLTVAADPAVSAADCATVNSCQALEASSESASFVDTPAECLVPNCVACSPVNDSVCEQCAQNYNMTSFLACAALGDAASGPVSAVAMLAVAAIALATAAL